MTTQDYKDAAKKLNQFVHESKIARKAPFYIMGLRFLWYLDYAIWGSHGCTFEEFIKKSPINN